MTFDGPRQAGTLRRFVAAASEMDAELRIFALEPWQPDSPSVATVVDLRLAQHQSKAHLFYAEVFGDGPESPTEGFSFFLYVGDLQAELRRLRRAGIKDATRLVAAAIAHARMRRVASA